MQHYRDTTFSIHFMDMETQEHIGTMPKVSSNPYKVGEEILLEIYIQSNNKDRLNKMIEGDEYPPKSFANYYIEKIEHNANINYGHNYPNGFIQEEFKSIHATNSIEITLRKLKDLK